MDDTKIIIGYDGAHDAVGVAGAIVDPVLVLPRTACGRKLPPSDTTPGVAATRQER